MSTELKFYNEHVIKKVCVESRKGLVNTLKILLKREFLDCIINL